VVVTLFTLLAQVVAFATQVVIAAAFGTGAAMDAFLAANTLPQYLLSVVLNALGFVFIPVFLEYGKQGREEDAWRLASAVITVCAVALGLLSLAGIVLAQPLLRVTTPGLPSTSLQLATRIAIITWPTLVFTGLVSLLTAIYHAQGRFGWPALVPVLGAVLNLALVAALAAGVGIVGVAVAALVSLVLQMVLLLPIALQERRFRPALGWRDSGVQEVLRLLLPLVVANVFVRSTPIVDRYLASDLAEGAISQLGYASRLVTIFSTLLAAGITTVIFPRMASDRAKGDLAALRHTTSLGLRFMWLTVAPVVTVGLALALPLITVLFRRGEFNDADAHAVARLVQVYLLALVSMCLSNVPGRALYALKETWTVGVVGVIEAIAYVVYTPLLAHRYGTAGIAVSFVIYFNTSLLWLLWLVRSKTGNVGGRGVTLSFFRTGLASVCGGLAAYAVTRGMSGVWMQLLIGASLGALVYTAVLMAVGSDEIRAMWRDLRASRPVLQPPTSAAQ
jgi:putative peptidoglycan lipid II flippase